MEQIRVTSLGWILVLMVLVGCQSIEELFQAGEYEKAFNAADRRLGQKPQEEKTLVLLEQSLEALITAQQEQFATLSGESEPAQWEKALDAVASMDKYLTKARAHIPDVYLEEQAQWWKDALALEEELYYHYLALGKNQLKQSLAEDNPRVGQNAYFNLRRVIRYQKDHFEEVDSLQNYLSEAQQAGTIYYKVAINGGFNIGLRMKVEQAFMDLNRKGGLFIDVEEVFIATGGDCAIDINFGEFEANSRESSSKKDFEERLIVDYLVQTDTSGNEFEEPVYADVTGTVETVTSTKIGSWEVRVDVRRSTANCHIFSERYREEVTSTIEYYRLSGDERAIPDRFKRNSFKEEHTSDEDLAEEALDNLVQSIYRGYFNG
jgi:hypothetical protein